MPPDEQTQVAQTGEGAETQVQAAPPAAPPQGDVANGATKQGKVHMIPNGAMRELKEREREKGRQQAALELAKQAGYTSVEEMTSALAALRNGGGANGNARTTENRPANRNGNGAGKQGNRPNGTNGADKRTSERWDRERKQLMQDREDLTRRMRHESSRRKELQEERDRLETEMALRESAVRAGVRDLDVAIELLRRDVKGKSEEELKGFDEGKYFESLRSDRPYLFGEVIRPANTGTGVGGAPPPPKPGDAAQNRANGNQLDAMKMDRSDFHKRIQQLGLNPSL